MSTQDNALTTPEKVYDALDTSKEKYSDDDIQNHITDATILVRQRVAPYMDSHLHRIATLVAAHFAANPGHGTGGRGAISSISRGDYSISFKAPSTPEENSKYWRRAMMLSNGLLGKTPDMKEDAQDSWGFKVI